MSKLLFNLKKGIENPTWKSKSKSSSIYLEGEYRVKEEEEGIWRSVTLLEPILR